MPDRPARYTPTPVAPRPLAHRPTAAARGYDGRWQKASRGYLDKHPLCVRCEERGQTVTATVVDHVIPHRGDKAKFWDRMNWQPLCKRCHDRKTATEDGGFGRVIRLDRLDGKGGHDQ